MGNELINLTAALADAHRRALASGHPVVVARDGAIRMLLPDGTEQVLKLSERPTPVTPGTTIRLTP